MINQPKINSFQYLASIDKNHSTLKTKMASMMLTSEKDSLAFSMAILTIEYLQLISQALLINPALYDDPNLHSIHKGVVYAAKLINPSFWMFVNDNYALTLAVFIVFILMTLGKFMLSLYLSAVVKFNLKGSKFLLNLWRLVSIVQPRVLCFFQTSFWVKAIMTTSQNGSNVLGIGDGSMIAISTLFIAYEYISSFFGQIRQYILPTKSFLAAKDNYLLLLNVTQKLVIHVLQMALSLDTPGIIWVFTSLNILFALTRGGHYYENLPLYKIKALTYQRRLLALVYSLNLACFMQNMLESLDFSSKMDFVVTAWIVLALLAVRVSDQLFNKLELDLITDRKRSSSVKLLLHKILTIRRLLKLRNEPTKYTKKYEYSLLMNRSLPSNIENILKITLDSKEDQDLDLDTNQICAQFLENLLLDFPKDEFLKLYYAYFYAKKLNLYGVAMKTIGILQKSPSAKISLGANLLVCGIEAQVEEDCLRKDNYLDVLTYLKSISQVAQMKQKILEQIKLQEILYYEVLSDTPNLEKIYQQSQKIKLYKTDIEKRIKTLVNEIPECYVEPLKISSLYHFSLSHSLSDYHHYFKIYSQMFQKYKKFFQSDKLMPENLYQENSVLLVLSGHMSDAGKIVFCTKNIKEAYGSEAHLYTGAHIVVVVPPSMQSTYMKMIELFARTGDSSIFRIPIRTFGVHKEGCIVEVDFQIMIHPFLTAGFFFDCIGRPTRTTKDYILIHPNGDIEGATETISRNLGLLKSQRRGLSGFVNIKTLSLELSTINEAFSFVQEFENSQKLEKEEGQEDSEAEPWKDNLAQAQQLSSSFSSKGKVIEFEPLLQEQNSRNRENLQRRTFKYYCSMIDQGYQGSSARLICLEEVKSDQNYEESSGEEEHLRPNLKSEDNSKNVQIAEELEEEVSDFFRSEDEKKPSWISFQPFDGQNTQRPLLTTSRKPEENIDSPEPLLPASSVTQKTGLFTERKSVRDSPKVLLNSISKSTKTVHKETNTKEEHIEQHLGIEGSISTSQKSKFSHDEKVSSAFKVAIATKYSSKSLIAITVTFYLLLLAVIASQVITKMTLDTAILHLKAGKDTIIDVEARSYYLGSIQNLARLASDVVLGRVNIADIGFYGGPPIIYAMMIEGNVNSLVGVNQRLISSMDSLDDNNRASLFQSDVRIFESYADRALGKFVNMTHFQATDRIIEVGMQVIHILPADSLGAQNQIAYLIENTVNDLMIKNDAISETFLTYFESEQKRIDELITTVIAVTVVFLVSISGIFTIIIWKKFSKEKFYLLAVAKLNSKAIRNALDRIASLKRTILSEVSSVENFEVKAKHYQTGAISGQMEHLKSANDSGIRKRYYFYTARLWFFMLLLLGLAISNCLTGKSSVAFFQSKHSQLFFINRLKSHISLVVTSSSELLASNGTTLNHNIPVSELNPTAIETLTAMRDRIAGMFMKKDSTYDPRIEDILFDKPCNYLTGLDQWMCGLVGVNGKKMGFIYILIECENILKDRLNKYEESNKSEQSLLTIHVEDLENLVTDYLLAGSYCNAISKIVNTEFEDEFTRAQTQRNIVVAGLSILVIITAMFLWLYVLRKIRDANQEFKTVLQAFPPNVVLSSFVLKKFLMKTSKGVLDFAKNDA